MAVSRGYSGAGISHSGASLWRAPLLHPESRRDATAATAATGRDTMHREARLDGKFYDPSAKSQNRTASKRFARSQRYLVATTSHEINRLLALRGNPAFSNALARLQKVQPGTATPGLGRIQQTHIGSTRKQRNGSATGRGKHVIGTTQNVIITITGVIVIIMITTGGIVIAPLSSLSAGAIGAGMTDGGIPPWGTIRHYSDYDYNGPIYGYDGLQPDEVIANVQAALSNWDITPTQLTEY